jgi:pyruvate/2-oxoglutarate dehydrogenase complex dihydrolipoamide dehydrogenase (E3) component
VFITTGAASIRPGIPGADGANVCTITEVLSGKTSIKDEDVLLIGSGLSGLETAHLLTENGCRVKIFEMAPQLAPGAWFQNVRDVVPKLEKAGTKFYTSKKLLEIRPDGIVAEDLISEKTEFYAGGRVVLSLGVKPVGDLQNQLRGKYERLYVAGDAVKGGYIIDSTLPAFEYARQLR